MKHIIYLNYMVQLIGISLEMKFLTVSKYIMYLSKVILPITDIQNETSNLIDLVPPDYSSSIRENSVLSYSAG